MEDKTRRRLRRFAWYFGGGLAVLAILLGGFAAAFILNFRLIPPKADYPAPASALEAQRQDLDYFSKAMALDRAFSPAARAAGEARIAALKALPEALPRAKLQVALMQVMASADNGHSRMRPIAEQGSLVLPLRVTRFAEGFYVMRAEAAHRGLLGGQVESIDGMPIQAALARLETLRGGVERFRRENAAVFMVVQDLLYGLGIATDPRASTWTVRLADGRLVTEHLSAFPLRKGDDLVNGVRWLSPEPAKGVERGWIAYRPRVGDVPESWRDFDNYFRLSDAAGSCAKVVRLQHIIDTDGQKIAPFLARAETALRADPPCALILDLRGDSGGNYTNIWHFTHALPDLVKPGGRIFVLTDPQTFSAAITATAFVKDAGGARVTIIGEPVGDRMPFYSEGGKACLPNLKVCVFYQTGKHDYVHGCHDWRECYWVNLAYPVRVASLEPDIFVPLTFEDWNAGRDAAYARALALIGQAKS